jgi:zinc protease
MKLPSMRRTAPLLLLALSCAALPGASQQTPPAPAGVTPGVKLVPDMPPPGPPRPFHFPAAVTRTLPNGLRVFVISVRTAGNEAVDPAVSIQLMIRNAGASRDPEGKPGLASFTGDLLTEGTEKRTAQEIAGAIDFVGGSLAAAAGRDATTLRVNVVKKDFNMAMDLLSDIALHAKFAPEEIARQREQLLSSLRVNYSDADYLASAVFQKVLFGANPYGMPADGTPDSARAFTREDLMAFRDQFYAPNEAVLGFAGDVTADEAFAAAEKFFGGWSKKELSPVRSDTAPRPRGLRIVVVDKPDTVQTQIRVGRPGIARSDPDYLPVMVANQIFGGSYNSRLNTAIRLKRGLSYDASASFTSFLRGGEFLADTFTRTEVTTEATRFVVDEIAQMASGEVTAEELNVARDYLAGVFAIGSETPDQVANRVLTGAFYGLPDDYNQTYPEKARGITAEQVRQVSARYFDASDLDLVLVGNASAFRDALRQAFPTAKYEEIPADQLDLLAPDLQRPQQGASPGPAARAPATPLVGVEVTARGNAPDLF